MLESKFVRFVLLLLAFACHVASAEPQEEKPKKIKMKYVLGDWRPHFGYVRGHKASEHKRRNHTSSTTTPEDADGTKPLNDYVVRLISKKEVICGGLVVGIQQVLTTKLCMYDRQLADISVKLNDGSMHKVASSTNASDYTMDTAVELLSLLKLEKELGKQYKKPPPICPRYVKLADNVELWKWDHRGAFLTKKSVPQLTEDVCKQRINDPEGLVVSNSVSCVENMRATKKCEKTFGLPYVWEGSFCGLNLMGHNCPNISTADVFVRLLREKLYISNKIKAVLESGIEEFIV